MILKASCGGAIRIRTEMSILYLTFKMQVIFLMEILLLVLPKMVLPIFSD